MRFVLKMWELSASFLPLQGGTSQPGKKEGQDCAACQRAFVFCVKAESNEDDGERKSDQADQAKPHPSLTRGTAFVGSLHGRHRLAHDMRKLEHTALYATVCLLQPGNRPRTCIASQQNNGAEGCLSQLSGSPFCGGKQKTTSLVLRSLSFQLI